ncbi:MAG: sugar transferase [Vulcanimicrobiota bacterium]
MTYRSHGKRLFDLVAAGLGLILLSPVLAGLALLVRQRLGSPVLFRQQRPGKDGKIFELVKFRSMTDERDPSGQLYPDERRLTPFGQFLRSTSLDELPELINVLKGEMSLVGPRPLLVKYLERYNDFQRRRLEVRPGITGWAQVNGRNATDWNERFRQDVYYIDHMSLALDLKILFMTVKAVVVREGISREGHATMPEFLGDD